MNTHIRVELTATHCNSLQLTATHCITLPCGHLRHIRIHKFPNPCRTQYKTLQLTATHCNTLQHIATHCVTLHHTASHYLVATDAMFVYMNTQIRVELPHLTRVLLLTPTHTHTYTHTCCHLCCVRIFTHTHTHIHTHTHTSVQNCRTRLEYAF